MVRYENHVKWRQPYWLILISLALASLLLSGCQFSRNKQIDAKGEKVTREFKEASYEELLIDAKMKIVVDTSVKETTLAIQDNLWKVTKVTDSANKLVIKTDIEFMFNEKDAPILYVNPAQLNKIKIKDKVALQCEQVLEKKSFSLIDEGETSGKLQIIAEDLVVESTGIGNLEITGSAKTAKLVLEGDGSLLAGTLDVAILKAAITGVGKIEVNSPNMIENEVVGDGKIVNMYEQK